MDSERNETHSHSRSGRFGETPATGREWKFRGVVLLFILFMTAGCSTVPHRVELLYNPVTTARGGSGTIYLAAPKKDCSQAKFPVRWVIGTVQDDSGTVEDEITTSVSPHDLLNDALKQELERAGYSVNLERDTTPPDERFIRFSNITFTLSQTHNLFKVTAAATVSATLEQWKSGKMVKKEEYESSYTDTYARTDEERVRDVLQKAIEGITGKALPDILQAYGK